MSRLCGFDDGGSPLPWPGRTFCFWLFHIPARAGEERERKGGGNTHAWVRVFLPNGGWVEFDPTNGLVGNKDLIRVAVLRDPYQPLTLAGSWEGESKDYLG